MPNPTPLAQRIAHAETNNHPDILLSEVLNLASEEDGPAVTARAEASRSNGYQTITVAEVAQLIRR